MNYSTTYANEVIKLLGVFALIFGLELPNETEAIVGALLVLGGSIWTLYQRHKAGQEGRAQDLTWYGQRK